MRGAALLPAPGHTARLIGFKCFYIVFSGYSDDGDSNHHKF